METNIRYTRHCRESGFVPEPKGDLNRFRSIRYFGRFADGVDGSCFNRRRNAP